MPMRFGDPVVGLRRRNRLAVGCTPYVCQHEFFLRIRTIRKIQNKRKELMVKFRNISYLSFVPYLKKKRGAKSFCFLSRVG
ncbi:MAG: hypothetical protein LBQ66_04800 [Planctomycetaceae bacterium]|nr:hypothetical protein [Planctomycetaceae bacterium]